MPTANMRFNFAEFVQAPVELCLARLFRKIKSNFVNDNYI